MQRILRILHSFYDRLSPFCPKFPKFDGENSDNTPKIIFNEIGYIYKDYSITRTVCYESYTSPTLQFIWVLTPSGNGETRPKVELQRSNDTCNGVKTRARVVKTRA